MGKRDALIAIYAEELKSRCGINPDLGLLTKVAVACGPAIYDPTEGLVQASDAELEAIRRKFLIGKLGLADGPRLTEAILAALEAYGPPEGQKHRAVVYYMLTRHFGKESAYK